MSAWSDQKFLHAMAVLCDGDIPEPAPNPEPMRDVPPRIGLAKGPDGEIIGIVPVEDWHAEHNARLCAEAKGIQLGMRNRSLTRALCVAATCFSMAFSALVFLAARWCWGY